ncbi:hypothetical protein FKP32DRAFT_1596447 [Trametes sanguinea]|nr:hypothetical protein FKP32DRAFT_1596447 [Trametes sanguinea]
MDADDYFDDDDLVLDDAVLAVLDREESKYKEAQRLTQQQAQTAERRPADAPPPIEPPPAKKQKVSHEWTGEEDSAIIVQPEDDEGLPDISILGAGSYRFPAAQRAAAHALAAQLHPQGNVVGESSRKPSDPVRTASRAPPPPVPKAPVASTSTSHASNLAASTSAATRPPQPTVQPVATSSNKPPSSAKPRRVSTLQSVQAALAGLTPPPSSNPSPSYRNPSVAPSRSARGSVPPRTSQAPSVSASQARLPQAASQAAHLTRSASFSSTTAAPSNRRTSVPGQPPPPVSQFSHVQPRPPPPLQPTSYSGAQSDSLRLELDSLKAQLDELLKAQAETAKALQEAQDARFAKEGEVSILRKNMEKTAKEHAAEVARIKAAREQAEAVQAQLRKEMAEERERLKAQYLFKQHELETSMRKTPWSLKIKRVDNQGPPTPVSSASQRRQLGANGHAGPSTSLLQTPSRPRIDKSLPNSPEHRSRRKFVDSPDPPKLGKLPGFRNAFEPSPLKASLHFSQLSQSTQVKGKGKDRAQPEQSFDLHDRPAEDLFFNPIPTEDHHPRSSPLSSPQEELREESLLMDAQKQPSGPSSSAEPADSTPPEDVEMKDESKPDEPPEPLQVPDWTKELHRIVLTHKSQGSKQPTLQLLMNFVMPSSVSADQAQEYSAQSARLLESLGTAALRVSDTDEVIQVVQHTLSAMGRILCTVGSVVQLTALLNLMNAIALFIPAFASLALAPTDENDDGDAPPEILMLLCESIRYHLAPKDCNLDETRNALASEVLGLLETVCWYTPADLAIRLSVFIRKAGVFSTLVHAEQPTWLLRRALRALTLLASYHSLWKHFLSFPLPDSPETAPVVKDYTRIPHIEQLASFLIDRVKDAPEHRPLREAILNFINTLAVAHTDALSILLQSHLLLPSIVAFLHNLTAPLWEEDGDFVADTELVTWTVQMTTRTVLLLHHLMTNADSSRINLRQKLMFPPKRFCNALWHMFTVSLGRISYAFPPDWAGMENAMRLDQICDLAKDVLEVAVDGPELESIWAAFHVDDSMPASKNQYDDDADMSRSNSL